MPVKSASDYINKLASEGNLDQAIEASMNSADFLSAAAEAGYSFTDAEWKEALASHSDNLSLSDDELSDIAGGYGPAPTPCDAINNTPR